MKHRFLHLIIIGLCASYTCLLGTARSQSSDDCLICHSDMELLSEDGRVVGIDETMFKSSIHGTLDCIDCHEQPSAVWDDFPHMKIYRRVDCAKCHEAARDNYLISFHGKALTVGNREAPGCLSCHGISMNPHNIQRLDASYTGNACRTCHTVETVKYDGSVHSIAASKGKNSPGCISCHPTHGKESPPSAGRINQFCITCHSGAMEQVRLGGHLLGTSEQSVMNCSSCHDVHAAKVPNLDDHTIGSCNECHPGYREQFAGSVHEDLISSSEMNCLSCHRTHQVLDPQNQIEFGCGKCHEPEEKEYRSSIHRIARLHGDRIAADCASCHGGHRVLSAKNPESSVFHKKIPETCGKCHTDATVITSDFVRLPISLPSYTKSVHGIGLAEDKPTAACTDCHGVHDMQSASSPSSSVSRVNIVSTCGKCHSKIADLYSGSVHGKALVHGIKDAPNCVDCHDEHLIRKTSDTSSPVSRTNLSGLVCKKCHEDAEMTARYGLAPEVVESYEDSYHGWAIQRGGKSVATCEDCHNTHDIRSSLDPESSIHPDNVVHTCGKCHEKSNERFSISYTHISARGKLMIHDYIRIVYIILIFIVLGGMLLHNLLILIHEYRFSYQSNLKKKAIRRMTADEIWQHIILAVTFFGLAISGFALRFPDTWWVILLTDMGMTEMSRRILHRVFAGALILLSFYHLIYVIRTKKGRYFLSSILISSKDFTNAWNSILYYLRIKSQPLAHGMFDYTQKVEYWALIWGIIIMGLTGFVLMYPDIATIWLPAWIVRVSETIHFYEAILAVGAILIWHFFFTMFRPSVYPMEWTWITGRMPFEVWKHHHGMESTENGYTPEILPPAKGKNTQENDP